MLEATRGSATITAGYSQSLKVLRDIDVVMSVIVAPLHGDEIRGWRGRDFGLNVNFEKQKRARRERRLSTQRIITR